MKFLANNKTDNHLTTLTNNLKLYDEAFFAVAFLKVSGLTKLIQTIKEFLKSGGKISIIAGQNFALTQPEALHTLRKLFQTYPTSKLYLAKANSTSSVFHPKLYLFKSNKDCCIISGSANITEGGLTNNKETSLIADCNDTDIVWNEAKIYFDSLVSSENADEATLLVIKQYETFYEQQKQHNKKSKPIPTKTKSLSQGLRPIIFSAQHLGKVGLINPMSCNFCDRCNRLRARAELDGRRAQDSSRAAWRSR